jgi:hypothetical protein
MEHTDHPLANVIAGLRCCGMSICGLLQRSKPGVHGTMLLLRCQRSEQ